MGSGHSDLLLFSYDPSAEILDYATTKAAIVGFTKGLADSLIEKGIRVNWVAVRVFSRTRFVH